MSARVHAADWHEREAEDMFGLVFEGHPRLGDFILHDDVWQEGVEPMRRAFDPERAIAERRPRENWRPRRVVEAPGVFVMPVGPVFSGEAESVNFQLETIGEEIIRAFPRLFFKYRAVEKMAEGPRAGRRAAAGRALRRHDVLRARAGLLRRGRANRRRRSAGARAGAARLPGGAGALPPPPRRHRGRLQLDRPDGLRQPDGHPRGGGPARLGRADGPPLPLRPRRCPAA